MFITYMVLRGLIDLVNERIISEEECQRLCDELGSNLDIITYILCERFPSEVIDMKSMYDDIREKVIDIVEQQIRLKSE